MKKYTGYLSGPMDACTSEEMNGWRDYVEKEFPQYEYLDPCRRYYTNSDWWKEIVELDKVDIARSDFILLNYWKNSNGTPMECILGHQTGKLVVIVNKSNLKSSQLSPWLKYHSTAIFDSWLDAFKFIDDYFEIKKPICTNPDVVSHMFGFDSTVGKDLVHNPVDESQEMALNGCGPFPPIYSK